MACLNIAEHPFDIMGIEMDDGSVHWHLSAVKWGVFLFGTGPYFADAVRSLQAFARTHMDEFDSPKEVLAFIASIDADPPERSSLNMIPLTIQK